MKNKKCGLAAVLMSVIALGGCATPEAIQKQQANQLFSLTKAHFYQTTRIKDGPLDTVVVMDTSQGFQEKRGILGLVTEDACLRGFVDKKTGKKSFQVYVVDVYNAPHWRFYSTANYQTPSGPRSVLVDKIASDVTSCSGYGSCLFEEDVAFDVDETLLRHVAKTYVPGKRNPWLFKLIPKAGPDLKDGITPAEVAGFLERMDSYKPIR